MDQTPKPAQIPVLATLMAALLAFGPFAAGCDQSCDPEAVCDAFFDAVGTRGSECGVTVIPNCPYDMPNPAVCDVAWRCVDQLESGAVGCGDLAGMSLASCAGDLPPGTSI